MRTSDFGRYALGICVAVAMLAGCGGGAQSQLAPSGLVSAEHCAVAPRPTARGPGNCG